MLHLQQFLEPRGPLLEHISRLYYTIQYYVIFPDAQPGFYSLTLGARLGPKPRSASSHAVALEALRPSATLAGLIGKAAEAAEAAEAVEAVEWFCGPVQVVNRAHSNENQ